MIKVNDIWKPVTSGKILVNEAWRDIISMKVSVAGVWRDMSFDEPQQTGIWYIEELDAIRNDLSGNHVLGRSLDFNNDSHYQNPANKSTYTTGSGWVPIGNSTTPFTGSFNGNGHTISNFYCNHGTSRNAAMFEYCVGADFSNILFANVYVTGNSAATLAVHYVSGTVHNCHVLSGSVLNNATYTGGLVAITTSTTFSKCSNNATVNYQSFGYYDAVGGICGLAYQNSSFSKCKNSGDIYGNEGVGGIVGMTWSAVTVSDSYNEGQISGLYVGAGILAASYGGGVDTIQRCYNTGQGVYETYGIVGYAEGSTVSDCFWDDSKTTSSNGGASRTTTQMKALSNYTNWSMATIASYVDETWKINEGTDYPRLGWE